MLHQHDDSTINIVEVLLLLLILLSHRTTVLRKWKYHVYLHHKFIAGRFHFIRYSTCTVFACNHRYTNWNCPLFACNTPAIYLQLPCICSEKLIYAHIAVILICCRSRLVDAHTRLRPLQCESKNLHYGFLKFFPKRLGIFNQFFTHLLCDHFYTRLQIFIQLSSPTLTKLCHTKRDHLANFYISLEL